MLYTRGIQQVDHKSRLYKTTKTLTLKRKCINKTLHRDKRGQQQKIPEAEQEVDIQDNNLLRRYKLIDVLNQRVEKESHSC